MTRQSIIDHRAWPGAAILGLVAAALWFFSAGWSAFAIFVLAGHLAFFRDPKRIPPPGNNPVSPADGQVVEISTVAENRYLKEEAVKIGIFLTLFVPHVSRAPLGGSIGYLQHEPGKFLNALRKESVIFNESNWIGIEQSGATAGAPTGVRILVRQIAGAIARRIYCDVQLNQNVDRGEKVGIICYSSRVECFFPKKNFRASVQIGDHVKAGTTVLGVQS